MKKELFVPGRTELAGNHTDHQNGRVLASAIDLGLYAVCETNGSKMIHVQSEGFNSFDVRCDHLLVRTTEFGTPKALVRGVVSAFSELGLKVGGFNAVIKSTLLNQMRSVTELQRIIEAQRPFSSRETFAKP